MGTVGSISEAPGLAGDSWISFCHVKTCATPRIWDIVQGKNQKILKPHLNFTCSGSSSGIFLILIVLDPAYNLPCDPFLSVDVRNAKIRTPLTIHSANKSYHKYDLTRSLTGKISATGPTIGIAEPRPESYPPKALDVVRSQCDALFHLAAFFVASSSILALDSLTSPGCKCCRPTCSIMKSPAALHRH